MSRWAVTVAARKWWVLAFTVIAVAASGAWGTGVFSKLSDGGFVDPSSESAQVARIVEGTVGSQHPDIVAVYTAPEGTPVDQIGQKVVAVLDRFTAEVPTRSVTSYWTAQPPEKALMLSKDGTRAVAAITLDGAENVDLTELLPRLEVAGVQVQFTGGTVIGQAFSHQLQKDLVRAEAIALPVTLLLLVLILGGLTAAAVPVFVGAVAVAASLALLRALTLITEISSYAINVASLIGLGLAIDYGLFIVSRFREELTSGSAPSEAARRTVLTAGRTVMFSGLLLVCAFAGMLVFPQAVIRSLGFGAIAAVSGAALLSLTAVPALLAILGHRINSLTWRAGAAERGEARARRFWGAMTARVLRRPLAVAVVITAGLLVLAAPLLGVRLGEVTYTALPADSPARTAMETLSTEFPATGDGATLVLQGTEEQAPSTQDVTAVLVAAARIDGVAQAMQIAERESDVIVQALYDGGIAPENVSATISSLRTIVAPPGTRLLVGGDQALVDDGNAAIVRWLPVMAAIMVGSTLILLFLAFRSIVLPLKAVAMAALSLAATFGALTWIFQMGNGADLLGVSPAPLEATFVVLILAVVFGLSTDYEVFLLSRMVEARSSGATTAEAVRFGAERTGRVVTAAALLLVVVTGAFTLSGLSIMRFLGVGMILALVIDATAVRMLLVPALVKLMGAANWWVPRWMTQTRLRGRETALESTPRQQTTV